MTPGHPAQLGLWGDGEPHDRAEDAVPPGASGPVREQLAVAQFRHPQAEREIVLGKAVVAYAVQRARRRSIGMVVGVEGLTVRAPRWVAWADIETALRAKERWICKKLGEQRERAHRQQAARIDWCEGASVPFLGESLVVVLEPGLKAPILRDGHAAQTGLPGVAQRALHVGLPQETPPEKIRDTVLAWMRHHARAHFSARVQHYAEQLQVRVTRITLSSARTRWGSASADGSIRLHWRLVHFSPAIIDYVVAHELAHLHEMNHSPRFWSVVRSVMPDYEGVREQLRHVVMPE